MTTVNIRGVPVDFPFDPYDLQKTYMESVIQCLQEELNGVLESPTGTGKTLSLLCSSLAWLQLKKAQLQAERQTFGSGEEQTGSFLGALKASMEKNLGKPVKARWMSGTPTIIYSSRTHSQLSQAMQELKRTSYNYMKATIMGSREQMCIHPDLKAETNNSIKTHMCRLKVKSRSCHLYNRVEKLKTDSKVCNTNIMDIEDLVKMGEDLKFCPYYMSKELKQEADIIFMPYNYLLDRRARKALGVELTNNIIILDEAHNIEKICEEAASFQLKATDLAMAIEEVTAVMKMIDEDNAGFGNDQAQDITPDQLCFVKKMLLDFEKAFDNLNVTDGPEGTTYEPTKLFELLQEANINHENFDTIRAINESITEFLTTVNEGPFARKGNGIQLFDDLIRIVLGESQNQMDKINKCFKMHVVLEKPQKKSDWLSKATTKHACKVLNYWCFSPGFGMKLLLDENVRSIILTSGTLAPLKPFISELEIQAKVRLENPHIVKNNQVCVKIIPNGPDMEVLNCNFQNRDNPKFINSLGNTIFNVTRLIPDGLLVFFPSYPLMQKFTQAWQDSGLWDRIRSIKNIYVEPKEKVAFNTAMESFYEKINDPQTGGAIFMGVCRGKVSEGLDFADANGRAVIIVGLPYPPLKDNKVILKKRYLDVCNANDREFLKGDDWYSLEATRAVNQAIGRVIRHKDDYGVILLMDTRFNNPRIRSQLSLWLRDRITVAKNFGEVIRDVRGFFREAALTLPPAKLKPLNAAEKAEFETTKTYKKNNFDFSTSSISTASSSSLSLDISSDSNTLKRNTSQPLPAPEIKRKKITLKANASISDDMPSTTATTKEYILMVKKTLDNMSFSHFLKGVKEYKATSEFETLCEYLDKVFLNKPQFRYLIPGLEGYIKDCDRPKFAVYWEKMKMF